MDNEKYKYRVLTLPNVLSFIRVAMIPFFVWFYSVKGEIVPSIIILGASAVTDVVDGFIARRYGMVSNVGRILDPAADKLTQLVVMACLCIKHHQMIIPLVLLVIKEIANGVIGLVMMHKNRDALDSKWHGKLTTVVIYLTSVVHLVWESIPKALSWTLIGVCIFMMILSFVLYTIRNFEIINEKNE
ncbi:MAG: CDP-alcohol phosphatidyltransferase family protein [Clostridia bacterium]|nr:CDP-alcohol phosphatidyltransferase family protein [Clostridia bacterium]